MRTMLILILLCSLAPFAAAQGSTRPTERDHQILGCGSPYECYAPEMCTDYTKQTVDQNVIITIPKDAKIYKDCPAIITIFPYRKYWAEVTIESVRLDTESIVLTQLENQDDTQLNKFTCEVDASDPTKNTIIQKYSREKTPKAPFQRETGGPIKCVFQIKLQPKDDIFGDPKASNFEFTIKYSNAIQESTGQHIIPMILPEGCDFSNIEFNKEKVEEKEVYAQVQQEKDKYSCKGSFVMKYLNSKSNEYKEVVSLKCLTKNKKFEVKYKDDLKEETDTVSYPDIRCVAEAKYFCKYEPKVKANEEKLAIVKGDIATQKESKLECKEPNKYLFVKGKPVFDSTIECLNYGGSQIWTVMKDRQKLAKNGVEAYCAKEVPCEIMYKLTQSKIPNGQVSHEFYPTCHGDGVLKDMHDQLATKFSCDKKTGTYKYFSGDNEIDLKDVTFKCIYPDVEKRNDAERTRINNRVAYGSLGAVFGGIGAIVIALFVATCVGRHVHNKAKAKRQAEQMKYNDAKYVQFAMNWKERAKDPRGHLAKPKSELSEASDTIKLNDMTIDARYAAQSKSAPNEGKMAQISSNYSAFALTAEKAPKQNEADLFKLRGVKCRSGKAKEIVCDETDKKYDYYEEKGFQNKP